MHTIFHDFSSSSHAQRALSRSVCGVDKTQISHPQVRGLNSQITNPNNPKIANWAGMVGKLEALCYFCSSPWSLAFPWNDTEDRAHVGAFFKFGRNFLLYGVWLYGLVTLILTPKLDKQYTRKRVKQKQITSPSNHEHVNWNLGDKFLINLWLPFNCLVVSRWFTSAQV